MTPRFIDRHRPARIVGFRRDGRPIYEIRGGQTLDQLVDQIETKSISLRQQWETKNAEMSKTTGGKMRSALTASQARAADRIGAELDQLDAQRRVVDERLAELRDEAERDRLAAELRAQIDPPGTTSTSTPGNVRGVPQTYDRASARAGTSFFRDLMAAGQGDQNAAQRLQRHSHERAVDGVRVNEERASSSGAYGALVPPAYLTDELSPVLRNGRPFWNALRHRDLPPTGLVAYVPKVTTGASVASQATENTSVNSTDQNSTTLSLPIITIAGQNQLSRQAIDRGVDIDQQLAEDLVGAWCAEADRQLWSGVGAGNQLLGVLQTAGINTATAYGAPITAGAFGTKVAGGIGAIAGTGSVVQPRMIFMHPRRWAWLNAQVDSAGRPLAVPGVAGPMNAAAVNGKPGAYGGDGQPNDPGFTIVGYLQGLPVVTDANMPTAFGTNSEDVVVILDNNASFVMSDPDQPLTIRYDQTYANQLTALFVCYGYAAATFQRYPTSVSRIGGADTTAGQGQIAPTF